MGVRQELLGEFLDVIKRGFQQTPPAVQGKIPQGYTLDSYKDAVNLGLFDNGAPPDEVLEMMRQNGTVGKMDGLQYSDGTSDIDRIRSGMNERVGEMNNFNGGEFQDIFPRYQNNFQFEGDVPTRFRVKKDPTHTGANPYRTDADFNYDTSQILKEPGYNDVSGINVEKANMYGNGDFMDAEGLLGKQPQYVRANEIPVDDYMMDPSLKIRQAMRDGNIDVLDNTNGELGTGGSWYDGKDNVKNLTDINIDSLISPGLSIEDVSKSRELSSKMLSQQGTQLQANKLIKQYQDKIDALGPRTIDNVAEIRELNSKIMTQEGKLFNAKNGS